MTGGNFLPLKEQDLEKIHHAALEILETIGVAVNLDGAPILSEKVTLWVNFGNETKRVVAGLLHSLVFGGIAFIGLKTLCELLQSIADSRPFEENNSGRVRLLAWLLVAWIAAEAGSPLQVLITNEGVSSALFTLSCRADPLDQ